MNRRSLLKKLAFSTLAGLTVVAAPSVMRWLPSNVSAQLNVLGHAVQGTRDGLVRASQDGGKTWQPWMNFGPHCAVQSFAERDGLLYAQVGIQGFSFWVKTGDGRTWLTVA